MVAGEGDYQNLGVSEGVEAVRLAVHARKSKIGGWVADLKRVGLAENEAAGREPNEYEGNKDTAVAVSHGMGLLGRRGLLPGESGQGDYR